MPEYTLKEYTEIKERFGKIRIQKLVINGTCQFDEFIIEIEQDGNLTEQIGKIHAIFEQYSNMNTLPDKKFKKLKLKNFKPEISSTAYEVKTKDLRIYFAHIEKSDSVIVVAGKKTSQKKDLKSFCSIFNDFSKNFNT